MAILYGQQNVDERYSPIVEPNLFCDTVIMPGITMTNKYEIGPAGQIFVHKLDNAEVSLGTPARDFVDTDAKDSLIPIQLNNNYQASRKIYGVQANAVAFNMGEEYMSNAVANVRETRQYSALACLAKEGTEVQDYTASTKDNVVANLVSLRKAVKDAHGKANYVLASTKVYALLLQNLGFVEAPDPAVVTGELFRRFGLNIIECNAFDKEDAEYYDSTGTKQTVDLTGVEMICGYNEAFSVIDNLEVMRLIDSELFAGSKAQVEINTGFKVTSPEQVQIAKLSV